MVEDIYHNTKGSMQKTLDSLKRDFLGLRSSKVSTMIVDNIKVEYYGALTPVNQVSSIVLQDATTIVITPWEKNLLKDIERSIAEANIGVNPSNDGDCIKLFFPPMTKEQRQVIAKDVKAMGEKAKIAIRNVRQDSNTCIKKLEKSKDITEDTSRVAHDEIQKYTDDYVKKIDSMVAAKEEEVLKV